MFKQFKMLEDGKMECWIDAFKIYRTLEESKVDVHVERSTLRKPEAVGGRSEHLAHRGNVMKSFLHQPGSDRATQPFA